MLYHKKDVGICEIIEINSGLANLYVQRTLHTILEVQVKVKVRYSFYLLSATVIFLFYVVE